MIEDYCTFTPGSPPTWTQFETKFDLGSMRLQSDSFEGQLRYMLTDSQCPKHIVIARLHLTTKGGVARIAGTTRSEYKPPFGDDVLAQPYLAIDVRLDDIFSTVPQVTGEIGSCTVFMNNLPSVTSTHEDMEHAMFFMIKGRKVFRCLASHSPTRPEVPMFKPSSQRCPRGWFDIELKPGSVLSVPPRRWHCVWSDEDSIGVSVTIGHHAPSPDVLENCFDDNTSRVSPDVVASVPNVVDDIEAPVT